MLHRALIMLLLLGALVAPARAQDVAQRAAMEQAQRLLAENSYARTIEAIDIIAGSTSPLAADILAALGARKVFLDASRKSAAYETEAGLFNFISGEKLAQRPDGASAVRVNNRVRNAISAALGSLRLQARDPAARLNAAAELLRAKNVAALPRVEAQLQREGDDKVRSALVQTRAALVLFDGKRPLQEQLAAIEDLKTFGDQDSIAALRAAAQSGNDSVREGARAAITSIENHLAVIAQVQNVWYGLSLGSVLLLAAIGLAITFGVMGVINMAHGEMVMLGAYTTFMVQEAFRAYAPGAFDLSLLVALPAAFLVAGGVGVAIERGIIRFLYGRPLETLLATWGVSLILQQAVRTIFGPTNREVGAPSYMSGSFDFLGLAITYNRLWIIIFTLVVFVALMIVLRATPLGLQMRAVTQNRRMAASMGIRTGYVDAMTFGLGSGIAGIAGVALSQIDNVSPNLGQSYIIDSFMVVVFGGVGNLWGTLVSAFALGITNKLLEPWAGAVLGKILILVLLILFIQKRPRGLFALKGRAVEA